MNSDLGIYLGAVYKIGTLFKFGRSSFYLVENVERSARGRKNRAVHKLVSCPVCAPEPVHRALTAENKRKPRVYATEAVRLDALLGCLRAVPAGRGFCVPERTVL